MTTSTDYTVTINEGHIQTIMAQGGTVLNLPNGETVYLSYKEDNRDG